MSAADEIKGAAGTAALYYDYKEKKYGGKENK